MKVKHLISHRSAITSSSNNEKIASSSAMMSSLDIGKYVENRLVLPDDIKHDLLVKPFLPITNADILPDDIKHDLLVKPFLPMAITNADILQHSNHS